MKTKLNPTELVRACGTVAVLAFSAALGLAGCAGDLEGDDFPNAITAGGPAGGSSGAGGAPTGGGGGTPSAGTSGMAPPMDACVTTAFMTTCSGLCHNATNSPTIGANLDLSGAEVGMRLADKPAMGMMAPCPPNPKLINTATPADSVLLHRIKGTGCGTQMPSPQMPLSPADQACIEAWINKF